MPASYYSRMTEDSSQGAPFQMKINFLHGTVSGGTEVSGDLSVTEGKDQVVGVGTVEESETAESVSVEVNPPPAVAAAFVPVPELLAEANVELSDFDAEYLTNLAITVHNDFNIRVLEVAGEERVHVVLTDNNTNRVIYDGIEPDDELGWGDVRTLEAAFLAVWQKAFGVEFGDDK